MSQKLIATALFAIVAGSTTAMAQFPASNANSAASPAATSQVATEGSIRAARESAADADARRCLEFPTNAQVITCAEKYRRDRRRA
jgi:hypothetical protein